MTSSILWALSYLHDPKAVEPLLRFWDKGIEREQVALALGNQGDKRAVGRLMAECEKCLAEAQNAIDRNSNAQAEMMCACAHALGQILDPAAIPLLKRMLELERSPTNGSGVYYRVSREAAEALRNFGFRVEEDREAGRHRIVAEPASNRPELAARSPMRRA